MSLKKLDNYELECVAAGIPNSAKYVVLAGFSLAICDLASCILKESIDDEFLYSYANYISKQFVSQILGCGAGELILKALKAFRKENPEVAELVIHKLKETGYVVLDFVGVKRDIIC